MLTREMVGGHIIALCLSMYSSVSDMNLAYGF